MSAIAEQWQRFWFEPAPASTAALVRIAVGLLCLGWALSLAPDIGAFYLSDGILPGRDAPPHQLLAWGPLTHAPDSVIVGTWLALVASSVCVVLGWRTRLMTILMFLALVAVQRRNPYILNGGDGLVRLLALYLVFVPAGRWLSLDARRGGGDVPLIAPWGLRLIQVQLAVLYLVAAGTKLAAAPWRDGTALAYAWRYDGIIRVVPPDWIIDHRPIIELLTLTSIAIELAIPLLIWFSATRVWVIALGVLLHLGIHVTLQVGFFSLAIFAAYLAFLPPERATALVHSMQRRLRSSRGGPKHAG